MPKEIADYVHRIGRTGRCGKTGIATTFINKHSPEEVLLDLKYLLIEAKQRLPLVLQTITGPDDAIVEVRRVFASLSRQPLQLLLLVVMTTTSLTLFSLPHTHTHTHTHAGGRTTWMYVLRRFGSSHQRVSEDGVARASIGSERQSRVFARIELINVACFFLWKCFFEGFYYFFCN